MLARQASLPEAGDNLDGGAGILVGPPHLFGEEASLLSRVLAAGVTHYLEFGLGGSTLAAIAAGAEIVVAVDSDPVWVTAIRAHAAVAPLVAAGRAAILHADIGPTGAWGFPRDGGRLPHWQRYIALPWAEWARRRLLPDLVYVDGRFRVACCYSVIVGCAGGGGPPPRLLLHDVTPERPGYLDVLTQFDLLEQVGSLCLLQPRADASAAGALASLLGRQFDPG